MAALKTGGKIHGEPAIRDQETGYYSAAVIDFDDNSIEAMHREREREPSRRSESTTDDKRVLDWQNDVAKSTVGGGSQVEKSSVGCGSQAGKNTARIIVNNVTAPAMVVSRSTAQIKDDSDMNARALIGTLLGAAAGAAVAYAMTKGEAANLQSPITQTITYQTVDAGQSHAARSTVSSRRSFPPAVSSHVSYDTPQRIDYPQAPIAGSGHSVLSRHSSRPKYLEGPKAAAGQALASTLIETFIPPSEFRRQPPHPIARSHTDSMIQHSKAVRNSDTISQHSRQSRASSAARTVTLKTLASIPRSTTRSEVKSSRDAPSPLDGVVGSPYPPVGLSQTPDLGLRSELGSVAPSDSVSQAGSRRSKTSRRSSRHGHSKLREPTAQDDNESHASDQTVRYRGSTSGKMNESAVSLPMRPSSKASAHRSVKSFLHGM